MLSARNALSAVFIFGTTSMLVIWIVLLASCRLVAGYCGVNTGPAGSLECIAIKEYNNGYQWSTCLSNAYIVVKSGGTHKCEDPTRQFCYYQCMLESHEIEKGPVFYDCACDPYSSLKTPLPAKCYSPDGTDCSWYKQCLQAKYQCEDPGSFFAIEYGDIFCNLYDQHYAKFNVIGRQWIDAVRKCLQVALVPLIRQYTSASCSKIKQTAYDSYNGCYTNPYIGAPSICKLDVKTILQVFVTVKSTFIDDFFATGDQLLETALQCGGVYAFNTIQIVLDGVDTDTDSIATVYNKVMKGLRSNLENELKSLADDILIAPFFPNSAQHTPSTRVTNVNVIFLSRAEYDLNYHGNHRVNIIAAVNWVMDVIETGKVYLGFQTLSVSKCVDTGCKNATRIVIPPRPISSAPVTLASWKILLTFGLLAMYAGH